MAQTSRPQSDALTRAVVLRAICMAGERVEVGSIVNLTRTQFVEARAAGKVAPAPAGVAEAAKPAPKPRKPKDEASDAEQ